jgi:hypothetical protein
LEVVGFFVDIVWGDRKLYSLLVTGTTTFFISFPREPWWARFRFYLLTVIRNTLFLGSAQNISKLHNCLPKNRLP